MKIIDIESESQKTKSEDNGNDLTSTFIKVEDLPSKFLPYPEGSSIRFSPFKFGEIQQISINKMSDEEAIEYFMPGIKTSGFDKYDLCHIDFMYIGLLRKISTLTNEKVNVTIKNCDECGESSSNVVSLMNIEFNDISPDIKLPINLKLSDETVLKFSPLTIRRYLELRKKLINLDDKINFLAACVNNMNYDNARKIINDITGPNYINALNIINLALNFAGVSILSRCRHCNHENRIQVEEVLDVITPFRESDESLDDILSFG